MYSRELQNQRGEVTYGYRAREIDDERSAVDHPGAARGPLSVCRWRKAGHVGRPDGRTGGAAVLVPEVPWRGRGARRARPGLSRASAHPAGPDPAGRGGAGDHHDRSDGRHVGGRYGRGGADERGRGAACCVRRLRPLAAGAVSPLVPPVGAPARQLSTKEASRKEQTSVGASLKATLDRFIGTLGGRLCTRGLCPSSV